MIITCRKIKNIQVRKVQEGTSSRLTIEKRVMETNTGDLMP